MVCASARKFVYRAFSIDRRGGYYEIFFCRDLGEFALACRRRGVGGRRHRNSTAGHASITRDALAGGSGCGVLRATSTARAAASCSPPAASSGGWSIWPAAWSISPAAVSSSPLIRSKAVPDSAARGHLGGLLRTLQRVPALPLPRDFARGSTGPLGGGQRAARRQGGLERGGFLGWLLVGADNRERDGTGEGDAIPPRTAVRIPPAFPAPSKPERTHSPSVRAAVMPQDRRTSFQTTQHTAQPPIVQPKRRSRSRSAESSKLSGGKAQTGSVKAAGRERASAWGRCGWPYRRSPLCAGRGVVQCPRQSCARAAAQPSSRPQRQNPGRSGSLILPAIGDPHRDELGPRGSPAVLRPLARPSRDLGSRQGTELTPSPTAKSTP